MKKNIFAGIYFIKMKLTENITYTYVFHLQKKIWSWSTSLEYMVILAKIHEILKMTTIFWGSVASEISVGGQKKIFFCDLPIHISSPPEFYIRIYFSHKDIWIPKLTWRNVPPFLFFSKLFAFFDHFFHIQKSSQSALAGNGRKKISS